jgi:hypothetical protein
VKVIGINYNQYVVELTEVELCRIVADGESERAPCVWDDPCRARHLIGKEFDVNAAYDRLRALKHNEQNLKTIIGQLTAMGELLKPVAIEIEKQTGGDSL